MNHREFFDSLASQWDEKIEREDLEKIEKILDEIEIENGNILDCGCGTGILYPFLIKKIDSKRTVFEMDISFQMLLNVKKKMAKFLIQGDAENMPLAPSSFKTVIFLNAFPHFRNKENVLKESFRILKDGGKLFILHTSPREKVNSLHKSHGGIIAEDLIPKDEEITQMLIRAKFKNIKIKKNEVFIVSAEKRH